LDSHDNIIVTGIVSDPVTWASLFLTVKYDPEGDLLWSKTYEPEGLSFFDYGIAVDSADNIVIAGAFFSFISGNTDIFFIKYAPDGSTAWSTSYDSGTYDASWSGASIAIDSIDDIIFVIYPEREFNPRLLRFSPDGSLLMDKLVVSEPPAVPGKILLKVDSSDNLILLGGERTNYLTIKPAPDGTILWSRSFDNGGVEAPRSLALDKNDNIIITGTSYDYKYWSGNYCTVKYDTNGNEQFHHILDLGNSGYQTGEIATGLAVTDSGHIILTGTSSSQPMEGDYCTVKLHH